MMMNAHRLAAATVGAALTLAPMSALAQTGSVHDPAIDRPKSVDVTKVTVRHGEDRISATIRIPELRLGKLSGTELLLQAKGKTKVYAVTVLRNRQGDVVDKALSWRPKNDPVEPELLPCTGIKSTHAAKRVTVSVPTACLTKSAPGKLIRAKVRTVDGTSGLGDAYFDDNTHWTPYLARGAA